MFKEVIKEAAAKFKDIKGPIRIISHFDSDGIASAAIITRLMQLEDRSFQLSIVKHFDETLAKELEIEQYETYFLTDLGSGQIELIKKYLPNKKIIILDHHAPKSEEKTDNIVHINPHLFGINGGREISGSGVTFLYAREVNDQIDEYAHIAIIGAIGDVQEKNGFIGLNKEILQIAVKKRKLIIKQDLKLFGSSGRNIAKILEFSNDIKDISDNREKVLEFLKELEIPYNKKLYELTEKEKDKLANAIIAKGRPENKVRGPVYILPNEKQDTPFYDIREFSTLLNACGRLEKHDLGIATLLEHKDSKIMALHTLSQYKEDLQNAIKWFNENKNKNEDIISTDKYVIINAKDKIVPNIVGTLASIVSKGAKYDYDFIITLSQYITGKTKISFRLGKRKKYDLRILAKKILENIDKAEFGGHTNAVGAIIPTSNEEMFINKLKVELDTLSLEESII